MYKVLGCTLVCGAVLFGVITLTLSRGAEGAGEPDAGGAAWAFRTCATVSPGYVLARFKPDTGETWYRRGTVWQAIADTEEAPAGPYDLTVLPSEGTMFYALRSNLRTGQAWYLSDNKWAAFTEPQQ